MLDLKLEKLLLALSANELDLGLPTACQVSCCASK
jgi:hypothetical protein